MIFRLLLPLLASIALLPSLACAQKLERGTAITDPQTLRALEQDSAGLGLNRFFPSKPNSTPIANDVLFTLPTMVPLRQAIDDEIDRYVRDRKDRVPRETIGVGPSFDIRVFDRSLLDSHDTRFVLAGVVNRMDRAYVTPQSCGEVRLIYRLTQTSQPQQADDTASPRLPMTLNVVLKARGGRALAEDGAAISCAEIARRWLATADSPPTGAKLAATLVSNGGALALIDADDIDRIETNLQIAYAPRSATREFETDYLLKIFRRDPHTGRFEQATLENQIDRDRILASDELRRDFHAWLLDPDHLRDFDSGAIVIPEKFLATRAVTVTPVGFDRSARQPSFGMVGPAGSGALFVDREIVDALKVAAGRGVEFANIQSVAGFERRLNDITCSGCHQTRAIGGFHFPGVDWMTPHPSNQTTVPASPQFFGDQVRRRDILVAVRDGLTPDYSRGFSDRPQLRGSEELLGTGYYDGWGAHCYDARANTSDAIASDNDASFRSWSCASGLACQAAGKTSRAARIGMCFVAGQ